MEVKASTNGEPAPKSSDHSDLNRSAIDSDETLDEGLSEHFVNQRVGPGILVMAAPMRLLHINQRAWDLARLIPNSGNGKNPSPGMKGLLPSCLLEVVHEIFRTLGDRTSAKDWEQFEVKRLLGGGKESVLVRGFGLPTPISPQQARVVILLEEVAFRKGKGVLQRKEQYSFTEREETVIQGLAKGWTNKEIAAALDIALPTVKEHLRHIMEKTKSTTRTGILVKVLL